MKSCKQTSSKLIQHQVDCVDLVASWMRSNRLRLNSDKTEVIWVSTSRRQHQLPVWSMFIDGSLVHPVRTVRNLGVFIDADLVMRSHVTRVVAQFFAVLRQLRLISRLLLEPCTGRAARGPGRAEPERVGPGLIK